MAGDIGLNNIQFVANKVTDPDDEQFIRKAFPDHDLLSVIPYSDNIRCADWDGQSVLDGLSADLLVRFEDILNKLEAGPGGDS